TAPSPVVVKDLAGVVDLGLGHDWAARTRSGQVFFVGSRGEGFRAVEQPGLRGVTAISHRGAFFGIMPDGSVTSSYDRHGSGGASGGVWGLHRRDELGPAAAVEKKSTGCIVRPTGKVACWGSNLGGACGSSDRAFSSELVGVKLPAD